MVKVLVQNTTDIIGNKLYKIRFLDNTGGIWSKLGREPYFR